MVVALDDGLDLGFEITREEGPSRQPALKKNAPLIDNRHAQFIRITVTYKRWDIVRVRATQKDVARLAGVSQATVSMVLSGGAPAISAETWERITKAARELGYAPNRAAQALRTSRTMTIACIVPDITNPFYPALIRGIQSVTDAISYDVLVRQHRRHARSASATSSTGSGRAASMA